ncbi:hypothetical protein [Halorhodospira neutriphila]|uniref:SHOCT domain-containing protein n=1 Tax=Halorhodospira neutriphila TaxID=168379 RepID=A0ABS1E441_9GAMM|nr:hypothetical protein [Halorhodospira neutriphila]MBK1725987.1 hypothetical protein [Halorhodospira neutriphila]
MSEVIAAAIVSLAIAVGATLWGWRRYWRRRGRGQPRRDALSAACYGDEMQAERLEALEQKRAGGALSRREARRRAAERLQRDR